jgi:hypothetical protein
LLENDRRPLESLAATGMRKGGYHDPPRLLIT